ncbi:MAG TPA: HAD family hydrolase [Stellaceae bacterium]|nr:HAD family hydrolase [Stellaceae bacterium]
MTARPRALLFDWDNTLVDTWETIHDALVVTFTALGQEPWTLQQTKLRVARSLRDAFPALFGARWEEALTLYLDRFRAIHLERLKALEGAAELLAELGQGDYFLGIVSNKTGAMLRQEAEHLGWTGHFRRIVGAGDAPQDKPDPAPMRLALEGSGIACSETWYVGDTALDMESAENAGCLPVLLGARPLAEESFARFRPALHFADCRGLGRHLRGL